MMCSQLRARQKKIFSYKEADFAVIVNTSCYVKQK